MPEIKNQFTGGKMNKDVDERLVPKGEYRDAMNIQVSTSESSDVGTVQNILGNALVSDQSFIQPGAFCVGSIADEKNDKAYFFIRTSFTNGLINVIIELDSTTNSIVPVLAVSNDVLKFTQDRLITGINIIDDMLFWTDNHSEPKKINITRSKEGTQFDAQGNLQPTRFINQDRSINFASNILVAEEHITVVKKAPLSSPNLSMTAERPGNSQGFTTTNFNLASTGSNVLLSVTGIGLNYEVGDVLLLQEVETPPFVFPITDGYDVRVVVESINGNDYTCSVLSVVDNISFATVQYACDIDASYEKLYKLKFARFAIRYKYIDGEYSTFSPFSEVAFKPGSWDEDVEKISYMPNTGYNLGMENRLRELKLTNLVQNSIPDGVKQIDILYKESNSPIVYIVDDIKPTDDSWLNDSYTIKQETIKLALPENQLLRPWDNVPKKAIAQEMTGNRIVYGNYEQNYDLEGFRPNMDVILKNRVEELATFKSVKSLRNYQLGVVFSDIYNRQTPVFSNNENSISSNKLDSSKSNQIEVTPNHTPPSWATHQKFYIKETSSEYYNLSLDRFFNAEDGNVWLSFASNDRDKIDIETSLYLKKKFNSNEAETTFEKYKVIDVKNEAPEFIKTRRVTLGKIQDGNSGILNVSASQLFPANGFIPSQGEDEFKVSIDELRDTILENFHKRHNSPDAGDLGALGISSIGGSPTPNAPLFIKISSVDSNDINTGFTTDYYEVDNVKKLANEYLIKLKKPFGDDASWNNTSTTVFTDPTTLVNQTNDGIKMVFEVAQDIVQNKSVFQGRFFVKILRDEYIQRSIVAQGAFQNVQVVKTANVGYLKDFAYQSLTNNTQADANAQISLINSNNAVPTTLPVNINAYWSREVWLEIQELLDDAGSRWVIDEAFSPGEEPLWGFNGFNRTTQLLGEPQGQSTLYGGQDFANANAYTVEHISLNSTTWMPDESGLGYANLDPAVFPTPLHTTGGGVQQNTIDISYIGPGRQSNTDFTQSNYGGNIPFSPLNAVDYDEWWSIKYGFDQDARDFANNLQQGSYIRFKNDADKIVYEITKVEKFYKFNYAENAKDHSYPNNTSGDWEFNTGCQQFSAFTNYEACYELARSYFNEAYFNRRLTFRLTLEAENGSSIGYNGYDPTVGDNTNDTKISSNYCPIEIVTLNYIEDLDVPFPENPAVFETEPKEDVGLEIFHEASNSLPLSFDGNEFAPVGSVIPSDNISTVYVNSWNGNIVNITSRSSLVSSVGGVTPTGNLLPFTVGQLIYFVRPDGSYTSAFVLSYDATNQNITVNTDVINNPVGLGWYNCYAFGNGVESNRIRDTFNSPFIDNGPKVSTILEEGYELERRKYGLIYSGLYNSTSGVNNLNQFIQAEKITKDINPSYGSIQKLHTRDSDLITLCEDKILRILANKDAVFNADGNTQLTATQNVLGQTIPFVGEYGISKNPESFASESYRAYFTDKVRGSVIRLSKDGLTPISEHGMKDYFRDNLKNNNKIIGSYDDKKDEYNVTLPNTGTTVSFKENVRGWVSFKSFVPENAVSCANDYYTSKEGKIWRHHVETTPETRNTFYGSHTSNDYSYVTTVLNDAPQLIKSFNTINYEGSQSKVDQFVADAATGLTDGQYYNLDPKKGWYVNSVFTNKETGSVSEFIEKEGKWFNYIKGNDVQHVGNVDILVNNDGSSSFDQASFAVQGLGTFDGTPVIQTNVYGCTDANATNYDPAATVDDGSCITIGNAIYGCMEPTATNYNSVVTANDNSCLWMGCTDITAINTTLFPPIAYTYNSGNSILDDGTCVSIALGCTDAAAFNYDATANTDDGSCIAVVNGCTDVLAINYSATANTDDGSCNYNGCTNPLATNYQPLATTDDGSCLGGGCTDPSASNYDPTVTFDDGSCIVLTSGCTDAVALNYNPNAQVDDGSCLYSVPGCTDPLASNYNTSATTDDGSCTYPVSGCTDDTAFNYNPSANTDDGSCIPFIFGCTDDTATNYNAAANTDNGSCTYPPAPVVGCMDPTACNYDINATSQGAGTKDCFWAVAGITVGDPTVGPVFYDDFLNPVANDTDKKVKHYVIGPTWPLTSSNSNDIGLSMKEGYNPTSWPPSLANLTSGLGVSGNTLNGVNNPNTKARVNLYKKDDPTNASSNWTLVHSLPSSQFSWYQNFFGGDTPGQGGPVLPKLFRDRLLSGQPMTGSAPHQPPYPWGPGQQDPNNYEFSVYYDNNGNKNIYKVEVYLSYSSSAYGISNGVLNADGTTCGTSYQFEIHDAACLENPFAVSGCTDPNACNYDQYATCDDGSCYYTTTNYYTPDPSGINNCFACETPGSGCSPSLPDCPLNSLGNLDFWSSSNNPTGNIFTSQAACDAVAGANITSSGAN